MFRTVSKYRYDVNLRALAAVPSDDPSGGGRVGGAAERAAFPSGHFSLDSFVRRIQRVSVALSEYRPSGPHSPADETGSRDAVKVKPK